MKVVMDCDEQYPTYYLSTDLRTYGDVYEVDARVVKRWQEVIAAYNKVQREMADVIGGDEY